MKFTKSFRLLPLLIVSAFTMACGFLGGQQTEPTPIASYPTKTQSVQIEIEASPTEKLEPTINPTATPTVLVTNTPVPETLGIIAFTAHVESGGENIYFMKSDGTDIHTPFSPMFLVFNSVWSPEGKYLIFEFVDGDFAGLKIYDPQSEFEKDLQVTSGMDSYLWSPDDRQLAYLAVDTCNVELYLPETDQIRQLGAGIYHESEPVPTCNFTMVGWDPDGHYLMLADSPMSPRRLIIIDVEADSVLAQIEITSFTSAALNRTANYLAFGLFNDETLPQVNGPAVAINDLQTDEWHTVAISETGDKDFYRVINWLSDGRLLFEWAQMVDGLIKASYWYFNPEEDVEPSPATDYRPPIERTEVSERLPSNVYLSVMSPWDFSESPDGTKVAIAVYNNGEEEIYIMDWDTGKLQGPFFQGFSPRWQPVQVKTLP